MDPEHLVDHTCEICFGAETAARFEEDDRKVMASREQMIAEESFRDAKGSGFILETVRSPILDTSEKVIGTVGIARDITRRKKTEEAIRLANRKLNLLSSITRHDVLNQLTVVIGFLHLAEESTSDPILLDYLGKMDTAAEIVHRQITFTRGVPGDRRPAAAMAGC